MFNLSALFHTPSAQALLTLAAAARCEQLGRDPRASGPMDSLLAKVQESISNWDGVLSQGAQLVLHSCADSSSARVNRRYKKVFVSVLYPGCTHGQGTRSCSQKDSGQGKQRTVFASIWTLSLTLLLVLDPGPLGNRNAGQKAHGFLELERRGSLESCLLAVVCLNGDGH